MTRNQPPRDTTRAMHEDPAEMLLLLAEGLASGGDPSKFILGQEAAGQRELVASNTIPADLGGGEAELVAAGFMLGEVCADDPLFRAVTLPEGWTRQPTDHDMWSHIVDELGRRRVAMFYKAAFYDRRAFTRVESVSSYVVGCLREETLPVLDEVWATKTAVLEALAAHLASCTAEAEQAKALGMASTADRARHEAEANQQLAARIEAAP